MNNDEFQSELNSETLLQVKNRLQYLMIACAVAFLVGALSIAFVAIVAFISLACNAYFKYYQMEMHDGTPRYVYGSHDKKKD